MVNLTMNTATYYTSTVELPFENFMSCYDTGNLKYLIIEGQPTDEELRKAWSDILMEYNDDLGDNEYKYFVRISNEYHRLRAKIKEIEITVQLLSLRYKKEDADDLNLILKTNYDFDVTDLKQYKNDLKRCLLRSREFEIKRQLKKFDLDTVEQRVNKGGGLKADKKYFLAILRTLSDKAGYKLNAKDMTTYEFCDRVRMAIKPTQGATS